jgi:hypothetical protein
VLLRGERVGGLPAIQREQGLHGHPLSGAALLQPDLSLCKRPDGLYGL